MAHIGVGAYGLLSGSFGVMFAVDNGPPGMLLVLGGVVVTALLIILAGLWLRDGRPRGAVLAVVLDSMLLVLLLWAARDITLDAMLAAALLGAVIWLWPTLADKEAATPGPV